MEYTSLVPKSVVYGAGIRQARDAFDKGRKRLGGLTEGLHEWAYQRQRRLQARASSHRAPYPSKQNKPTQKLAGALTGYSFGDASLPSRSAVQQGSPLSVCKLPGLPCYQRESSLTSKLEVACIQNYGCKITTRFIIQYIGIYVVHYTISQKLFTGGPAAAAAPQALQPLAR